MPEQYREKRGSAFTLSRAHDTGYYVRARCALCSLKRIYAPLDLVQLVGDIALPQLERKIRCDKCGKREFMEVNFWSPAARELEGLIIRRVAGVRTVRKVIWRDETR